MPGHTGIQEHMNRWQTDCWCCDNTLGCWCCGNTLGWPVVWRLGTPGHTGIQEHMNRWQTPRSANTLTPRVFVLQEHHNSGVSQHATSSLHYLMAQSASHQLVAGRYWVYISVLAPKQSMFLKCLMSMSKATTPSLFSLSNNHIPASAPWLV